MNKLMAANREPKVFMKQPALNLAPSRWWIPFGTLAAPQEEPGEPGAAAGEEGPAHQGTEVPSVYKLLENVPENAAAAAGAATAGAAAAGAATGGAAAAEAAAEAAG